MRDDNEDAHLGTTGHCIAIYVIANDDDFKVAAANCAEGGLLRTNSNFEDRILDVESSMKIKQFCFRDIIDNETSCMSWSMKYDPRAITSF